MASAGLEQGRLFWLSIQLVAALDGQPWFFILQVTAGRILFWAFLRRHGRPQDSISHRL